MSYPLSRLMSLATAGYGVYALAEPGHLGRALQVSGKQAEGFDALAMTYGVRDLTISGFAVLGRSPRTVRTAMRLRILNDVGDGLLLAARTSDPDVRTKVLSVTLGWATLNTLALVIDGRRDDSEG